MATLRLFAQAREAAGARSLEIEAATVGDLLAEARFRFGDPFGTVLDGSKVWLNGSPARPADSIGPADEVAVELGSPKSANMVMLGAYLQKRGLLTPDQASEALRDVLAERYHKTIAVNTEALRRGAEFAVCHA